MSAADRAACADTQHWAPVPKWIDLDFAVNVHTSAWSFRAVDALSASSRFDRLDKARAWEMKTGIAEAIDADRWSIVADVELVLAP